MSEWDRVVKIAEQNPARKELILKLCSEYRDMSESNKKIVSDAIRATASAQPLPC